MEEKLDGPSLESTVPAEQLVLAETEHSASPASFSPSDEEVMAARDHQAAIEAPDAQGLGAVIETGVRDDEEQLSTDTTLAPSHTFVQATETTTSGAAAPLTEADVSGLCEMALQKVIEEEPHDNGPEEAGEKPGDEQPAPLHPPTPPNEEPDADCEDAEVPTAEGETVTTKEATEVSSPPLAPAELPNASGDGDGSIPEEVEGASPPSPTEEPAPTPVIPPAPSPPPTAAAAAAAANRKSRRAKRKIASLDEDHPIFVAQRNWRENLGHCSPPAVREPAPMAEEEEVMRSLTEWQDQPHLVYGELLWKYAQKEMLALMLQRNQCAVVITEDEKAATCQATDDRAGLPPRQVRGVESSITGQPQKVKEEVHEEEPSVSS